MCPHHSPQATTKEAQCHCRGWGRPPLVPLTVSSLFTSTPWQPFPPRPHLDLLTTWNSFLSRRTTAPQLVHTTQLTLHLDLPPSRTLTSLRAPHPFCASSKTPCPLPVSSPPPSRSLPLRLSSTLRGGSRGPSLAFWLHFRLSYPVAIILALAWHNPDSG